MIKFCLKFGKSAIKTFQIVNNAYYESVMVRIPVFAVAWSFYIAFIKRIRPVLWKDWSFFLLCDDAPAHDCHRIFGQKHCYSILVPSFASVFTKCKSFRLSVVSEVEDEAQVRLICHHHHQEAARMSS